MDEPIVRKTYENENMEIVEMSIEQQEEIMEEDYEEQLDRYYFSLENIRLDLMEYVKERCIPLCQTMTMKKFLEFAER